MTFLTQISFCLLKMAQKLGTKISLSPLFLHFSPSYEQIIWRMFQFYFLVDTLDHFHWFTFYLNLNSNWTYSFSLDIWFEFSPHFWQFYNIHLKIHPSLHFEFLFYLPSCLDKNSSKHGGPCPDYQWVERCRRQQGRRAVFGRYLLLSSIRPYKWKGIQSHKSDDILKSIFG